MLLEATWLDFGSILGGWGKVLGGFWEEFSSILGDSGLLWLFLGYWGVFNRFLYDFCWCSLLLAAPELELNQS